MDVTVVHDDFATGTPVTTTSKKDRLPAYCEQAANLLTRGAVARGYVVPDARSDGWSADARRLLC